MMASTRVIEKARRDLSAYAEDVALSWDEFGLAVIDSLQEAIPNDGAVFAAVDPDSGLFTRLVRSRIDDAHDELFVQIELTEPDPITLATLAKTRSGVRILGDYLSDDPMSNARCRELLGPHYDLQHEMRGVGRIRGRMWSAVALYRPAAQTGFSAEEARTLASFEEIINRGMRRYLSADGSRGSTSAQGDQGVLIVDARGQVEDATAPGTEWLAALDGSDSERLPTAIRMAAAAARSHPLRDSAPCRVYTRSDDGEWVTVSAAALGSRSDDQRVAVTIERAGPEIVLTIALDAYDLTPRESEIVRGVVTGASTAELATSLGITGNTVQDHLKSVFSKAGVRSRGELVSRFCGFATAA